MAPARRRLTSGNRSLGPRGRSDFRRPGVRKFTQSARAERGLSPNRRGSVPGADQAREAMSGPNSAGALLLAAVPAHAGRDGAIATAGARPFARRVLALLLPAPLFLIFEVWQLVLSERYLGIKQIARGADPRRLGLAETTAFFWSAGLLAYWFWMMVLLLDPVGRLPGLGLLVVTAVGFSLRRGAVLKWILVILTFEGAVRVGLLLSIIRLVWQRL